MSFQSETPQMNSRNRIRRMAPSTRLKMIWPPRAGFTFLISVAASRGRYLYMKMKKASEMAMLTAASQPLRAAAFSLVADFGEDSASLRFGGTAEAAVATWSVVE